MDKNKVCKVRDLAEEVFVGIAPSKRRGRAKGAPGSADWPTFSIVTVKNIDALSGSLDLGEESLEAVAIDPKKLNPRYRLRDGDVVLTARGSLYKVGIVRDPPEQLLPGGNLVVVRPSGAIRPELLYAYLTSDEVRFFLEGTSRGSAIGVLSISASMIANLEIRVPSLEEQGGLARLIELAEEQYRMAVRAATLRRDAAHSIVAERLVTRQAAA